MLKHVTIQMHVKYPHGFGLGIALATLAQRLIPIYQVPRRETTDQGRCPPSLLNCGPVQGLGLILAAMTDDG